MQLAIEFKLPDIDPTYKAMRKQKAKEVREDRKRRKNNSSSNQNSESVVASYNGLHRKLSGNPEVEGAEELWNNYNSYMMYSYFGVNKN